MKIEEILKGSTYTVLSGDESIEINDALNMIVER